MSSAYQFPVDIGNRALQLCGARRIVTFADTSKNAASVAFVYDKLRQAEMRRNIWRFTIREAVLRPIDTNSRLVTFPAYSDVTTYGANAVVIGSDGLAYYSTLDANVGNDPTLGSPWTLYFGALVAQAYDATTTYYAGEIVYVSANVYLSLTSSNADDPPTANWRLLDAATLSSFQFIYPIGSGPSNQSSTRNVFRLPNGFLREAVQDPTAGIYQFLGGPVGNWQNDWSFEGDYLVTRSQGPIVFRFAADIADVAAMDSLFCEGLACRIGLEVCEELTQSDAKLQTIGQKYKMFMSDARSINGIETGTEQPAEDTYLTVRQ